MLFALIRVLLQNGAEASVSGYNNALIVIESMTLRVFAAWKDERTLVHSLKSDMPSLSITQPVAGTLRLVIGVVGLWETRRSYRALSTDWLRGNNLL
jgi:hypothetical protein